MSGLTSPRTYAALAAFQAADAVAGAIPLPLITKALDQLGVPAASLLAIYATLTLKGPDRG